MNFFRKKDSAFITLESPDLSGERGKLWDQMNHALEGQPLGHVTLRLYDSAQISLRALSLIASLGLRLKTEGVGYALEAPPGIIQIIRKLNFSVAFSDLKEVD